MNNKVYAKAVDGMDGLIRVIGVLRRKEFDVQDVILKKSEDSEFSNLVITIDAQNQTAMKRAVNQIEKIMNVYDVKLEGEL